jgi:hypothetical protein
MDSCAVNYAVRFSPFPDNNKVLILAGLQETVDCVASEIALECRDNSQVERLQE